ncbi:hypothetical protein GLF_1689 [Gluconobacter frateurii NBRC 101659]|nr:hypothetical protein GLF_1689 [Gluconobacter frateurii NBRC 101659]
MARRFSGLITHNEQYICKKRRRQRNRPCAPQTGLGDVDGGRSWGRVDAANGMEIRASTEALFSAISRPSGPPSSQSSPREMIPSLRGSKCLWQSGPEKVRLSFREWTSPLHERLWVTPGRPLRVFFAPRTLCPIKEINGCKFTLPDLLRAVVSNEAGKGALRSVQGNGNSVT